MAGPRLCDVHIVGYDEDAREYVCYTRHFLMTAGATRVRFVRDQTFGRPLELDNFATYCQRRVWVMRSTDFSSNRFHSYTHFLLTLSLIFNDRNT